VTTIFISYRRDDEPGAAGRLYDSLVRELGERSVFIDVDGIAPGTDFVRVIEDVLQRSDVMVAIVGRHWLAPKETGGRPRLEDPDDFVRLEIGSALKRSAEHGDIRLLPLCVEGARMPRAEELPSELAAFARLQAFTLSHVTWRRDFARLLDWLGAQPASADRPTGRKRGLWALPAARPRALALGLIVAAAAGAVALAVALTGGSSRTSVGEVAGPPIALQARPTAIAAGAGGVWVTEKGIRENTGQLEQIDPRSGRIQGQPIQIDGLPLGVAVGEGAVWVSAQQINRDGSVGGTVTTVDPKTRRVFGKPIKVGAAPKDIAIGEGAVWTADAGDGSVTRVDPATRQAKTHFGLGDRAEPADIAVGYGAVWLVQFQNQSLVRINPARVKALKRIPVSEKPEAVIAGAGAVWTTSLTRDTVTKIDPATNAQVGQPTAVGSHPDDLAIWRGGVYVAAKDAGVVQRIDPVTGALDSDSIKVGNEPDALAVYDGRLWVTNAADNSVVQIRD